MNKTQCVKAVASTTGLTRAEAAKVVKATFDAIAQCMQRGETFAIQGFGTFSVRESKARTGYNPHTGKKMRIAARRKVRFSPAAALRLGLEAPEQPDEKPAARPSVKSNATKLSAKTATKKRSKAPGGGTLF